MLFNAYYNSSRRGRKLYLGSADLKQNNKKNVFANTETWCWQMGARLQWFPTESRNTVIFNSIVDGGQGSVVMNLDNKKVVNKYKYPIYSVNNSGDIALYLNFSRLHRLRPGYGYQNFSDTTKGQLAPDDDGLFHLNLETGKNKLLFSLLEIKGIEPESSMKNAEHYINHILFSPKGDKYLFFHIWNQKGRKFSRLMLAGDEDDLRCMHAPQEGNVSHYTWRNNNEILLTASNRGKLEYMLLNARTRGTRLIGVGQLTEDGHPTFVPGNDSFFVSDTYPDNYRNQSLFLYDMKRNEKKQLGEFYSPAKFRRSYRCDLHPRFNRDGSQVCVDSTYRGRRQIIVMPIKESLIDYYG